MNFLQVFSKINIVLELLNVYYLDILKCQSILENIKVTNAKTIFYVNREIEAAASIRRRKNIKIFLSEMERINDVKIAFEYMKKSEDLNFKLNSAITLLVKADIN